MDLDTIISAVETKNVTCQ